MCCACADCLENILSSEGESAENIFLPGSTIVDQLSVFVINLCPNTASYLATLVVCVQTVLLHAVIQSVKRRGIACRPPAAYPDLGSRF